MLNFDTSGTFALFTFLLNTYMQLEKVHVRKTVLCGKIVHEPQLLLTPSIILSILLHPNGKIHITPPSFPPPIPFTHPNPTTAPSPNINRAYALLINQHPFITLPCPSRLVSTR